MAKGNHKYREGLKEIVALREILNEGKGRTRKYNAIDVLKSCLEESSETNTPRSNK